MAGRKAGFKMHEAQRERIQVSMIVNRLQDCLAGKVELSAQQVNAAKILLGKVLPDLSATELSGGIEQRSVMRMPTPSKDKDEWKPSRPTVQ